jgi:DNA-binding MarR family transcriptional regulator
MAKYCPYIPAVPTSWIEEMLSGIRSQKVKTTAASVSIILALNTAYCLNNRAEKITIPRKLLKVFLVSRYTATTTLSNLEKAGLVKLERRNGCSIKISLLHPPPLKRRSHYE